MIYIKNNQLICTTLDSFSAYYHMVLFLSSFGLLYSIKHKVHFKLFIGSWHFFGRYASITLFYVDNHRFSNHALTVR